MLNTSELVIPVTRPDGTTYMAPRFEWDGARDQAATDVAEGTWRVPEIADRAGVSANVIRAWQKHPEFIARVDELCAEMRERVKMLGIARVEVRVAAQNERWLAMRQVISERAEAGYAVPGGRSGMLAYDQKQIGGGEQARIVDVYLFDGGLMKEIRELENLAAKELGQHVEKKEISGAGGGPIQVQAMILAELMTPDELETLKRRAQEKAAGAPVVIDQVPEIAPVVSSNSEPEEFPA